MIRFIKMPFSETPDHDCKVVVIGKHGYVDAMNYTVEGGWNTHRASDGTLTNEYAMTADEIIISWDYWLKKAKVNGEEWFDTMAIIMEEADKLRQQYEEEGICDDKCDALDEMRDHLAQAMNFAEVFTW